MSKYDYKRTIIHNRLKLFGWLTRTLLTLPDTHGRWRSPRAAGTESRKRVLSLYFRGTHSPLTFHDAHPVLAFELTHLWQKQTVNVFGLFTSFGQYKI